MSGIYLDLGNGNPGALTAVASMISELGTPEAYVALDRLRELNIRGTDLYVIWSDICERNVMLTHKLVMISDGSKLVDAASRQDYSGKELLATELEQARGELSQ